MRVLEGIQNTHQMVFYLEVCTYSIISTLQTSEEEEEEELQRHEAGCSFQLPVFEDVVSEISASYVICQYFVRSNTFSTASSGQEIPINRIFPDWLHNAIQRCLTFSTRVLRMSVSAASKIRRSSFRMFCSGSHMANIFCVVIGSANVISDQLTHRLNSRRSVSTTSTLSLLPRPAQEKCGESLDSRCW